MIAIIDGRRIDRIGVGLLLLFYAVGLAAQLIPATRPLMLPLTPYILVVFGLLVVVRAALSAERGWGRFLLWGVVTTLFTFAAEVIGVSTGRVFGAYHYGSVLGAKLAGVPLVIGFNWTLVVLGAVLPVQCAVERLLVGKADAPRSLAARIAGPVATSLAAGVFAALFDATMEPTAVRLGYWQWGGGAIPLQNYASWLLLAALSALLFVGLRIKVRSSLPVAYLVIQWCFFAVLDIGLQIS